MSLVLGSTVSMALFGGRADALPVRSVIPMAPVVPMGRAAISPTAEPVLAAATSALGTPYRWGGTAPGGFDCSGFVRWAWSQAGVALPHNSAAQRGATRPVGAEDLQPGDLVFYGRPVSHVAIYVGDGMIIHSPRPGDVVKIVPLDRGVGTAIVGFGRVK